MKAPAALPRLREMLDGGVSLKDAIRRVHRATGASQSGLRMAYYRSERGPSLRRGGCKLTPDQQELLVGVLQAFSIANLPLSNTQVRYLVWERWEVKVGSGWLRRFVSRHREHLSRRACKALSDKRQGSEVLSAVESFCEELELFLRHRHFTADAVMNYDETRVVIKGGKMVVDLVVAAGKERANVASSRHGTVASLLSFVAADGSVFVSVYVLKSSFHDNDSATVDFRLHPVPRSSRRAWPRFYCWTPTGYLNTGSFGEVVRQVVAEWGVRNPGKPVLLFGDQLGAHMDPGLIEWALQHQAFSFFLPVNTSHFLQPLDAAPFAAFHRILRTLNEAAVMDGFLANESTRNCLLDCAYRAEVRAMTPQVIRGAFVRLGLWPFRKERVLARARENLGVPSDGPSVREQAAAAAADVIAAARERTAAVKSQARAGRAVVVQGKVHSPEALLALHKEREQEEHARAAARTRHRQARAARRVARQLDQEAAVAARVGRRCRQCQECAHRGGRGWSVCRCGQFRLCPRCRVGMVGAAMIAGHVSACPST